MHDALKKHICFLKSKGVAGILYLCYRTRIEIEFNFEFGFEKSNLIGKVSKLRHHRPPPGGGADVIFWSLSTNPQSTILQKENLNLHFFFCFVKDFFLNFWKKIKSLLRHYPTPPLGEGVGAYVILKPSLRAHEGGPPLNLVAG